MGTVLEATLHARDRASASAQLDAAIGDAKHLETLLSRHDPDSEVSRLNRRAGQGAVAVSPLLAEVVERAHRATTATRGAFDPSVGPLVTLWTEAARRDRIPDARELAAALERVGPSRFRVASRAVVLEAGSRLDLGGIAKGFALDRMAERLRGADVAAALLAFGQSSVWALGAPPGEEGWRLLVRGPAGGVVGTVVLRDQALSVSGSLSQGSRIEGRDFGHVLDPRSGWPLTLRRQALVVAPDATEAEVLSTALLVLGEEEGVELVEALPGCEGLLLDAAGGRWQTSGFTALAGFEPLALPTPRGPSESDPSWVARRRGSFRFASTASRPYAPRGFRPGVP
jgi:thiamine biosynthesis lipoprotein